MTSLFESPWFYWAVGIAIGLPLSLVLLTEWQHALQRRKSYLFEPVTVLRNYLLPLAALLLLMVEASQVPPEATSVRMVSTLLAFVVLVLVLSGHQRRAVPERSRWDLAQADSGDLPRRRPFRGDRGRLGDDLRLHLGCQRQGLVHRAGHHLHRHRPYAAEFGRPDHLRAADALRAAVPDSATGSIRPAAKGRVVEVNWRAVHLETGTGLQITPNSVLAGASFTNLSRPAGQAHDHRDQAPSRSTTPPTRCAPCWCGWPPSCRSAIPTGARRRFPWAPWTYTTTIPLRSPG